MAGNRIADELLKWGLRNTDTGDQQPSGTNLPTSNSNISASNADNSTGGPSSSIAAISADITSGKRPDLADPALYNAIMGKSEAQMMQEELGVAVDEGRTEEDRCTALDNYEMLIEQVDNANNIENMRMWPPLLSLLSSPSPSIQLAAAWILGTAVQNNDKAQMALLSHNPFPALITLLEHSESAEVRSKAMYALSGLLKHNPKAVALWEKEYEGWRKLAAALRDPNMGLRRRTAFLLGSLLLQDEEERSAAGPSSARPPAAVAGLIGPPSTSDAPVSATRSTAIAPMPASERSNESQSESQSESRLPPAPFERGPATLAEGVPHPNVAVAMQESGLLKTLISSLLPPPASPEEEAILEPISAAGPDGDQEARTDLDYAEKATRVVFTFVQRALQNKLRLTDESKALLRKVLEEVKGPPIDSTESSSRWAELGLEKSEVDEFEARLQKLLAL